MTHTPDQAEQQILLEIANGCRCNNLRQAARAVTTFYNGHLGPTGLTAAQCPLLVTLMLAGPQQIQALANRMGLDRTTLTRNLRVLVAQQYVQIVAGQDQRTRVVQITDHGWATLQAALPHWQAAQHAFITALGEATSTHLFDACRSAAALDPPA